MAQRQPLKDIQFIADFAAFCRTKGDELYDVTDARVCALAQFGYPEVSDWDMLGVPESAFWEVFDSEADQASDWCAFSALADRLEALIADAPEIVR